jgi:hypothetical protein
VLRLRPFGKDQANEGFGPSITLRPQVPVVMHMANFINPESSIITGMYGKIRSF